MKTAGGDTVSVAAHKAQHHQLKADEYAKKGYAYGIVKPAVYATPAVASYASPLVTYANTYATGMPFYHQIGKREAEADSQYFYNAGIYANGYNGYALPNVYNTVASPVVYNSGVYANGYAVPKVYNTFAGVHSIGKREADSDSDSQMVYTTAFGGYPLTNTATFGNVYNAGVYGAAYPAMSTYTNGVVSSYPKTYYSGYAGHRVFKREAEAEAEADSQWVYNNAYTPYAGYTGYNAFSGYTTPYNYGNVWNRAQYLW